MRKIYFLILVLLLFVGVWLAWNFYISRPAISELSDLIRVADPAPDTVISSPLLVAGEARGSWYFEASFPVKLLDGNGKEIASAPAQAKEPWMTENFVPFEVSLEFSRPETSNGYLILKKDNPSGLPEHDRELKIPVRFR